MLNGATASAGPAARIMICFGVVPVTTVRPTETERGGTPVDRIDRIAIEVDKKSSGLPVGVQVAGPPFTDERVLAVMLALESALQASPDLPRVPRAPG